MLNQMNFDIKGGLVKAEKGENQRGPYVNARLAVTDKWTDRNGEKREVTHYVTVHCPQSWMTDKLEHAQPGNRLHATGYIKTSTFTDGEGKERTGFDFFASDVEILFDDRRHDHKARAA